jgi:hypothetical protein
MGRIDCFALSALAMTLFCMNTAFCAGSFFITIEKVELKSARGEWLTVIEPDRRLDLAEEEPRVTFFNNGRIPAGDYTNVRLALMAEEASTKKVTLERKTDYDPPLSIKKGAFVNVSFALDLERASRVSADTVRRVNVTVDQDERVDGGDNINVWS